MIFITFETVNISFIYFPSFMLTHIYGYVKVSKHMKILRKYTNFFQINLKSKFSSSLDSLK